ncbi:MAG: 5-(carboxyamino)imidazole ribonucleotide synthase [Cyanobacteria bacterium]|nr:5-(carboxyamino)imidazole ribonucleotide synthase [Cyanobacteriota bacterium]
MVQPPGAQSVTDLAPAPSSADRPTLGVVGGGQLAWMLAAAARDLQLPLIVQTPGADDPATALATGVVQAPIADLQATRELASRCSVITFENEWVDLEGLAELARDGVTFIPSLAALAPLVDKLGQRQLLQRLGIPCPHWTLLSDLGKAPSPLPPGWSFPLMAKAATGGYDGKGTRLLRHRTDLEQLLAEVDPQQWMVEAFVDFELELSQLVCRDQQGRVLCYPIVQTHQHRQVCDWVLAPGAVPHAVQAFARNTAVSLLTAIDYVGVLSIEFFYGADGLQVNEIAPRTHNSGHVTIEASHTSQFSQQARIVAGLPMGEVGLKVPGALMVNLLGFEDGESAYAIQRQQLAALPAASVHWYGKQASSPGRKLGHVTLLLSAAEAGARRKEAMERLAEVRAIWPLPETLKSARTAVE